jgi:hypothetical protein
VILVLLVLGVVLLALPGAVRVPPHRLPPHEWTSVAFVSIVAGTAALLAGLMLAAVPAVAAALGIPDVAHECRGALAPLATEPTFLSWIAAALAIVLTARIGGASISSFRRARRARVEPWLGDHDPRDGFDLVTVPADAPLAFGVPGRTPQVVISTALTERLQRNELEAVVDHEAAHLRLHHPRMLAVLRGIDVGLGVAPFVAGSVRRLRAAFEVWADAVVEGQSPADRRSLEAALLDVAAADAGAHAASEARDRIGRLRRRAHPRPVVVRAAVYAPVAVLVLTVAVTAAGWFTDAHHAVALGAPCGS